MPEIVCYRANPISYWIARSLIRVKYISLVNLILDKEAVKEMIQGDLNTDNLAAELDKLLHDFKRQRQLLEDYETLKDVMGNAGASGKAAEIIVNGLK